MSFFSWLWSQLYFFQIRLRAQRFDDRCLLHAGETQGGPGGGRVSCSQTGPHSTTGIRDVTGELAEELCWCHSNPRNKHWPLCHSPTAHNTLNSTYIAVECNSNWTQCETKKIKTQTKYAQKTPHTAPQFFGVLLDTARYWECTVYV